MIARKDGQPKARKLMAQQLDNKHSVRVGGVIDVRFVPGSALQHTDRLSSRAFGRWTESTTKREIKITTSQLRGWLWFFAFAPSQRTLSKPLVDVGRGSHSVGRIYGDLGDSVCEDISQVAYPVRYILPGLCFTYVRGLFFMCPLYSVIDDLIIQVLISLCHQP